MAEQGGARAQTELGDRYENGRGLERDYAAAVSWFRRAAEQGYAAAQTELGYAYERGGGVRADRAAAERCAVLLGGAPDSEVRPEV